MNGESNSYSTNPFYREVEETRLVIGVDYGTTYTGIAYATPAGTKCKLSEVDMITDWGPDMENEPKVPSVISYSKSTRGEQQWGSSISDKAVSMVHTKLELGLQKVSGELDLTLQVLDGMKNLNFDKMMSAAGDGGLPAYSYKSPEDIVTDYLLRVFEWVDQERGNWTEAFAKHTKTDIVVTIPTHWSYTAINSTYRAITKAGFNQTSFPKLDDVMFITESEAASIYTARHYSDDMNEHLLQQNQYFILCDAGGGTVDVVSYKVETLEPTLQLEPIGRPTGSKCGSIFINQAFKKWLRKLLGESNYRNLDPDLDIDKIASHASETPEMRLLMKAFDERKRNFDMDTRDMRMDLPAPLDDLDIPGKIKKGEITIRRADMEFFFDQCIAEILKLIKEHVDQIEYRGSRPKHVFLVGGFGQSEYLQHHLDLALRELNIQYRRPNDSWTTVVQGAVICGIEKNHMPGLMKTTFCRHSYAVCLDELFSETYHAYDDRLQTNGTAIARSQLTWLLNKGDVILSHEIRRIERDINLKISKSTRKLTKLPIYRNSSSDSERPTRFRNAIAEFEEACILSIDCSRIKLDECVRERDRGLGRRPEIYRTILKLVLALDWNYLEASIWWNGTELAKGSVKYHET